MNIGQNMLRHTFTPHKAIIDAIAPTGLGLAIGAGLFAVLSGLGNRWGMWHFTTGFTILRWSAIAGLVAAAVSLAGGVLSGREFHRTRIYFSLAGILVGAIVAGIPGSWMMTAQQMPRIHDITTDMDNPPRFVAIMPLRKEAQNPAEYGGPQVAVQQRAAFPDIKPLVLPMPVGTAFERALQTARNMGWDIVEADARNGRIEAMARTFWFGFTDDIVVRITPMPGNSRIDVRSVSRVGLSDIGTNAKRVRAYLRRISEESSS